MRALQRIGAVVLLVFTFFGLFSVTSELVMPPSLRAQAAADPAGQAAAAGGLLLVTLIDVGFIIAAVLTSRLRGAKLWLLVAGVYWGAKTFTSQLEAWYFMPNVNASLLPALLIMTVPVALVVPLLAVLLFGRWKGPAEQPAWRVPAMGSAQQAWKWLVLSAVVYPTLFFTAGYFIAFSSPEVRAFYGGVFKDTFVAHLQAILGADPTLFVFEVFRGALWVAFAVALLWTTRGRPWVGGALVVVLFSLVQNDVHVIPNPLMPPTVRFFHFIETASSNALFAVIITWLMHRRHGDPHRPQAPHGRQVHALHG